MIIGDINLSHPFIKYNVEVTHSASRKPTAIEWAILRVMEKTSDIRGYEDTSLEEIFSKIFTISDSELLVKPCLIDLQDLGMLFVSGMTDDTSLEEIKMSNIRLTRHGEELQEKGLLPGESRSDNIIIYYDIVRGDLFEKKPKQINENSNGAMVENITTSNEVLFPALDINNMLQDIKHSRQKSNFQWLERNTEISNIKSVHDQLLWVNTNKKLELGENGLCRFADSSEYPRINELIFQDSIIPNAIENLSEVVIKNPDEEFKDIFFIKELDERLSNAMNGKNNFIVNCNSWNETQLVIGKSVGTSVIIVSNSEAYSFEKEGKSIKIMLDRDYLPENCKYLEPTEAIYVGTMRLNNEYGEKHAEFGYIPRQHERDWTSVIRNIVKDFYERDIRVLVLFQIIGEKDSIYEYLEKSLKNEMTLSSKSNLLNILEELYNSTFGKKLETYNLAKKIFVDEVLEGRQFKGFEELDTMFKVIDEIDNYQKNDNLMDDMFKGMLEKTSAGSIEDVWRIWEQIIQYKKSYMSWINKNGIGFELYSPEVVKSIIKKFGDENFIEMEGYTQIERTFIGLRRVHDQLVELLSEIDLRQNQSDETILETLIKKKEHLVAIRDALKIWRDGIIDIDSRVCPIEELLDTRSSFGIFNDKTIQLMDIIGVFFSEDTLKYSKVYVLDTSVLMKDPEIIASFNDGKAKVIVPTVVLEELDGLKESHDKEKEFAARAAIVQIKNHEFHDWFDTKANADLDLLPVDLKKSSRDNMILSVALKYFVKKPCLITEDINLLNKARSQSISAMDRASYIESKQNTSNKRKKKK